MLLINFSLKVNMKISEKKTAFYLCPQPENKTFLPNKPSIDLINWLSNEIKNSEVIVLAETKSIENWCISNDIRFISKLNFVSKEYQKPCTSKMFECIFKEKNNYSIQVFMNDDLILNKRFTALIDFANNIKSDFLISGKRLNIDRTFDFNIFGAHQHWGTDYFIFKLPFPLAIKDYIYARFAWDSHILSNVCRNRKKLGIITIDATDYFKPLHPNHNYSWGNKGNKSSRPNYTHPTIFRNLRKTSVFEWYNLKSFDWILQSHDSTCDTPIINRKSLTRRRKDYVYRCRFFVNWFRVYLKNIISFTKFI